MGAAGINFAEILMRENRYAVAPELPAVLGTEAAGVIDAGLVVPLPAALSFEVATALMIQGLTALNLTRQACRRLGYQGGTRRTF